MRFKVFWTVSAFIIVGFIGMFIFSQESSQGSQNEVKDAVKNKFQGVYNETIKEYGDGRSNSDILDPCKMAEDLGEIAEITQCGKEGLPED